MCAKSLQSYPTLCGPMDCRLTDSSVRRFSRQADWSGYPCSPPGDLPDLGIKSESPMSLALAGRLFTAEQPGKP